MTASELIKRLQELVEEHGDLEVESNSEFLYSIEGVKPEVGNSEYKWFELY